MTEKKNVLILKITLLLIKEKIYIKKSYVLYHVKINIINCKLIINNIIYVLHK